MGKEYYGNFEKKKTEVFYKYVKICMTYLKEIGM